MKEAGSEERIEGGSDGKTEGVIEGGSIEKHE